MVGHHLIFGDLEDYLTGEVLKDTHDERYRQKLARLLVERKGFSKSEISPRMALRVQAGDKCAIIKIDLGVVLSKQMYMIIKYGPGSIVTRHRPALAASRLLTTYQIPVVAVTNGEDAEILDGFTGKIIHTGLASIPSRWELLKNVSPDQFIPVSAERAQMESRILYAFDVDGSCPCDDTICRIEWNEG